MQAQEEKDKYFKDVFSKEIEYKDDKMSRESHSSKYTYTHPQRIPEWCNNLPASSDRSVYALGISDPGLDSAIARPQALQRAEIMANIFRKSTVQLLCDFYEGGDDNIRKSIYEHGAQLYTYLPECTDCSQVLYETQNAFGEYIILINYNPPRFISKKKLSTVRSEVYKSDVSRNRSGEFKIIYELLLMNKYRLLQQPAFYEYTELGRHLEVRSMAENDTLFVPIYSLKYITDSSQIILSHGLWQSYFKSSIDQILDMARSKPENVRYLEDDFNQNEQKKQVLGKSENLIKVSLNGLSFKKEEFCIKITEQ